MEMEPPLTKRIRQQVCAWQGSLIFRHFRAKELKQIGPDLLARQELEHLSRTKSIQLLLCEQSR